MPHNWQPTNPRDDREQVNKAREAAEALFAPKEQLKRTEAPTSTPIVPLQIQQPALRTPRIIAISATMPAAVIVGPSTDSKPKSRRQSSRRRVKVPAIQHDRVRTLASYGMTLAEIADLYGVPVDVIDRIVAAGTDDRASAIE